jgi:poly(3-hydroxybutyrate) depolymerase
MAAQFRVYCFVVAACLFQSFSAVSVCAEVRRNDRCTSPTSVRSHQTAGTSELSIHSPARGGERRFLLFKSLGNAISEPTPLILAFHGNAQNASTMEFQTQLFSPEFNNNTIIAYPQGIVKQWTGDPGAPLTSEIDDFEFANDLDYIEREYALTQAASMRRVSPMAVG